MTGIAIMKLKLPYVVEDMDRHGNVRIYYRQPGQPKVRLRERPGTPEFLAEYQAAAEGRIKPQPKRQAPPAGGSFRWLCARYYESAEFKGLDDRTRHVRRLILDGFCEKHGHRPFARMEDTHIRRFRDLKADKPEAANSLVKALRQVFAWAKAAKHVRTNPALEVPYIKTGSEGHHSWTLSEIEQYEARHPIGTPARLALALLLYTGQRRSDIVQFGRQHVRDGWLTFTQAKNRGRRPVTLQIPIIPTLQSIIDATPSGNLTFLVTSFGQPFTANGFGNRFRKWCDEAGLPHCSAHGLRKAASARLAELGASEMHIMAVTGHKTSKEVARYTRAARQKIMAAEAMKLLVAQTDEEQSVPPSEPVQKSGTISGSK